MFHEIWLLDLRRIHCKCLLERSLSFSHSLSLSLFSPRLTELCIPFCQLLCFLCRRSQQVDLKHKYQKGDSSEILIGMDLTAFYLSVEWDIMSVPARRKEKYYSCCEEPYPDITFNVTLRRKTLFYTVNLICPCILISALSVIVFYLPSDSGEKVPTLKPLHSLCPTLLPCGLAYFPITLYFLT